MEIFLIRHGQSLGNASGTVQGHSCQGLSPLGFNQSEALSETLKDLEISSIYSSDIGRALQTAKPTIDKLGLEVKIDPDLREAEFGIWEGMTYQGVKEKFPKEYNAWYEDYFIRPHWFESYNSHFNRIKSAIEKILSAEKSNSKVLVFTHGGSIKTQLGFFKKFSGKELVEFRTKNCSLTLLKFEDSNLYDAGEMIYFNKQVLDDKFYPQDLIQKV